MQKLFNYNNKIYQEDYCAEIVDDSQFIIGKAYWCSNQIAVIQINLENNDIYYVYF